MLESIFNILKIVNGETENIRIAQGKHDLPNSLKGAFKKIKTELKWQGK